MQRVIEYLFRSILCVVLLLTGWALLRIFVCDQFVVPSESMSPTLIAGDRILANKLVAGARIYKKIEFGKDIPLRSFRMPGLREVRPNDVVIFNAPRGYDRGRIEFRINYVYTKRCIGAPGDSISIREGYFHNNRHTAPIGNLDQQRRLNRTPDSLIPRKVLRTIPFDDRNFGWTIVPCGDTALNLLGLSTQVPSQWVYVSDGAYKEYSFDNTVIKFKRTTNKEVSKLSYKTALTIQALKALGKDNVSEQIICRLKKALCEEDKEKMLTEAKSATSWVYEYIKAICKGDE